MSKHKNYRKPYRPSGDAIRTDLISVIREVLNKHNIEYTGAEMAAFADWFIPELWGQFQKYRNVQREAAEDELRNARISINNGTQGRPYPTCRLTMPCTLTCDYTVEGLDKAGLSCTRGDTDGTFTIEGTPREKGRFPITIRCKYKGWKPGDKLLERTLNFEVNPDPRSLWRNIPSSENIVYPKPDTAKDYIKVPASPDGEPQKDIVAASQRGRSHAQEGKPRDDHFLLHHSDDNGWYIMTVADGAGSAKYSRKGSEIACKCVVDFLKDKLNDSEAFEADIQNYKSVKDNPASESIARKKVGDHVWSLLVHAAHKAHKAINDTAIVCGDNCRPKDFATTLMIAICKKFDFGWFVGTFWVGDGAVCLYNQDKQAFKLMGVPDEGEFSGQTRFLTMPEIFSDSAALYKRLRFDVYDDFTALMLMTDGVSDPMFGTDANLNSLERWNDFWQTLHDGFPDDGIPGVDLTDDNEQASEQLLQWLNFWKTGEHDDRTIAILY